MRAIFWHQTYKKRHTPSRFFAGRKLVAEEWDGKSKYKVSETEEAEATREVKWEEFLKEEA